MTMHHAWRTRSGSIRNALAIVTMVVAIGACASNARATGEPEATVRIENQAWSQMTIYAVADGQRVRLGNVPASSTATFTVPSNIVGLGRNLVFVADPLGGARTSRSFEVFVRPGEEITLTIPPQAG